MATPSVAIFSLTEKIETSSRSSRIRRNAFSYTALRVNTKVVQKEGLLNPKEPVITKQHLDSWNRLHEVWGNDDDGVYQAEFEYQKQRLGLSNEQKLI